MLNIPPSPPRSSKETRNDLLQAGLHCFATLGYEGTSTRLVASLARKNSSLIAYHFGGKEGLYREVIRNLAARLSPPATQVARPAAGPARLRSATAGVLARLHPGVHPSDPLWAASTRLWLAELSAPRAVTKDLLQDYLRPLATEFRACIQEIAPRLGDSEVEFWGAMALAACFGQVLMAELNSLVWPQVEACTDPTAISERLANAISHALRQISSPANIAIPPIPGASS